MKDPYKIKPDQITGPIEHPESADTCDTCEGEGTVECDECNGDGTKSCGAKCCDESHNCEACKGLGEEPCPDCDGAGVDDAFALIAAEAEYLWKRDIGRGVTTGTRDLYIGFAKASYAAGELTPKEQAA